MLIPLRLPLELPERHHLTRSNHETPPEGDSSVPGVSWDDRSRAWKAGYTINQHQLLNTTRDTKAEAEMLVLDTHQRLLMLHEQALHKVTQDLHNGIIPDLPETVLVVWDDGTDDNLSQALAMLRHLTDAEKKALRDAL